MKNYECLPNTQKSLKTRFPCNIKNICGVRLFISPIFAEPTVSTHYCRCKQMESWVNTLRPRQDGCRLPDDTFKRIFLNENVRISIKISLKFVPKGPINNNPALDQIMACRRSGGQLVYWRIYASLGLNELSWPVILITLYHRCCRISFYFHNNFFRYHSVKGEHYVLNIILNYNNFSFLRVHIYES